MKNSHERDAMIKKLQEQKSTVPKHSFFGDDNHRAIDYQIKVIKEELSEDDIYDRGLEHYVEIMALHTAQWLDGDVSDDEFLGD